jgi:hypothetical protein
MSNATAAEVQVSKNCRLCGTPMHLLQTSDGSVWYHDTVAAEHACWTEHRAEIERGESE